MFFAPLFRGELSKICIANFGLRGCILILLLSCCWAVSDKFQYIQLKRSKHYPLTLTPNNARPKLTDILVDLPERNELKELGTYADAYREHPHPAEYRNGTLYLLKKKTTHNGILTELWQYRGEKAVLIHSAYDYLTFRVSPDDKYLALFADKKLYLLTTGGEQKRKLNWPDLYPRSAPPKAQYQLTPAEWNDKSTEFWFVIKDAGNRVVRIFQLSSQNWKYIPYDDLPLKPIEYAVNPAGSIAYSDRGLNPKQNFSTLYIHNLRTGKTEIVATSNYSFDPEWRGNHLDFNSPANGKTRVAKFE